MIKSNEWTMWHLTPSGWIKGSSKIDFSATNEIAVPHDRVLSYIYREYNSGPNLKTNIEEEYKGKNDTLIEKLLQQFGNCPNEL